MSDTPLPTTGTRCVHKDDHAKGQGPVWEVVEVNTQKPKPIQINHANHKMNYDREPETRRLTGEEFSQNYNQL